MRNLNGLTVTKKGSLIVSKKSFGMAFYLVRGFGCVENEVLSTYGKSA